MIRAISVHLSDSVPGIQLVLCRYAALLPLFFKAHPLHHLYAKFHADIAPIAGHDGMKFPGGDFHWLHHAKYECNYGVPLIDFDRLFGTWRDYGEFEAETLAKAKVAMCSDAAAGMESVR